ncbi:class I SAM-dependent methyltransferase [Pseudoduganella umbonata]|uniref:Methyltransferase domain-containing protein n=1 Tax=Pseudoduganella umbonata TaxID=864828 RepID=A0A4P8HKN9_9BURK|nr:class I SAM-dependent methyltransferase [Pseudoduganella umbonata]MBB3221136.1 SAM-dependent methyltransferase [Pseudoduganella umbonata]QCP10329.1 methyltransferase domain-containing protein [Pseudoduganella umbonata]
MPDWSAGYVSDIGYTYGVYPELNPLRVRLAFLNAGLVFPEQGHACELGFGQGVSVNVHAAASATQWHGTDFNPVQAGFARELAAASGADAHLGDASFAEFCARPDLPDFDFICLHGVWSWVSDENRHVLVDFVRRKLKVGGVLYISYNTQPGWAALSPVRELMTRHYATMTVPSADIGQRIGQALGFADALLATDPGFVQANPHIPARMELLKASSTAYLAHEYFNRDWQPMSFPALADWLAPARLDFACPATYVEHIDSAIVTPEQARFLQGVTDPALKQMAFDFMINQQFRRDYWVRGARRLAPLERARLLRGQRVVLVMAPDDVAYTVKAGQIEVGLNEAMHRPVIETLADHLPRTIGELETACAAAGLTAVQTQQAVFQLAGTQQVQPAQDDAAIERALPACRRLNEHLLALAEHRGDIHYLASPVTGGGIPVPRLHQLFLLGQARGHGQAGELVAFAMALGAGRDLRPVHGEAAATVDQQVALLERQAAAFLQRRLPVLQALAVVS